jgi:hypothetical protein
MSIAGSTHACRHYSRRYAKREAAEAANCLATGSEKKIMRKTILTVLAAALIAASSAPLAAAAEHHYARKINHVPASGRLRNANDAVPRRHSPARIQTAGPTSAKPT